MSILERLRRLLGSDEIPAPSRAVEGEAHPDGPRSISCPEALERIQEYLDGELEGVPREEVAYHFSVCQQCYPHLRLEEQFRELLHRNRERETCPEHLRAQVLALLAVDGEKPM
jgi:anti-sigma factor (TIGR02949 family)